MRYTGRHTLKNMNVKVEIKHRGEERGEENK